MFGVKFGKFLYFYLDDRGIEANSDNCHTIIKMKTPSTKERITNMNRRLATLKRFTSKSIQHTLPFYKLLRNEVQFE